MKNKLLTFTQSRRTLLLMGAAASSSVLLTGCPLLFVGGAALGVKTALDRRSTGAQVEDQTLELKVKQTIVDAVGNDGHINVTSYNRQVLLTGEVSSSEIKRRAQNAALQVANIKGVVNALAVGPNTTMGSRSNDTYITGRVKSALASADGVSAADVKVVTERSVVYLLGLVTVREAQMAGDVAASVDGVQKVVRVFEIISERDLQEWQEHNKPPEVKDGGAGQGFVVE